MRSFRELLAQWLAGDTRAARKMRQYQVWDRWETVVGPRIAAVTKPLRVLDTTLVIGVADSTWLQELCYLKPDLLAKLQTQTGAETITDLRFELHPRLGNT
ncbi:MAG: DUF721 domain-containing protein [Deltaproteobacteria bacterium]|nr:DUF721 domain-containing protein [Deltaproteobacteria bacterium]